MGLLSALSRWAERYHGARAECDVDVLSPEELEQKRLDLRFLQFELVKVRTKNHELERSIHSLRETLAEVFQLSDEKLRHAAQRFPPRENAGVWKVATEYCCLGGCDLGVYTFPTERDALLFSAALAAVGYKLRSNEACPDCYHEYMKDCI